MQSERTTGKGNCKIMCFKIAYRSFVLCSCDLKDSTFRHDNTVIGFSVRHILIFPADHFPHHNYQITSYTDHTGLLEAFLTVYI